MRLTTVRLIIAIALSTALAGVAGPSQAQSAAFGARHGSPVSPQLRNRYERFEGRGGTLLFAECKFKLNHRPVNLAASLGYAANSLGKRHELVDVQDDQAPVQGAPVPSGYTLDWVGVLTTGSDPITFEAADANFEMSGTALDPNTNYYLYVYVTSCAGGCGNWTLLSSAPLGMPNNESLVGPSPLQGGYVFGGQNVTMDLVLVH